ncbi:hypothetical protein [Parasedimentitalea maritima]|uniref:DUF1127 domain-containing protein n=1 Tax=Parasedimentitalea maritima TaxID=2578117 RepID=A0A6A4RGG3_9RHOB|nr:hypothetical protein [Zongyanglinia marina]KAE9630477.1 hypothetical protein GP644_08730 [Zongyanglinia marina]
MTTHCIEHQPQRSLWTGLKLRWPQKRRDQLVRQLQARSSLRDLSSHIQKDIGLFNETGRPPFTRW